MTRPRELRVIAVSWQELMNAHQGPAADDPEWTPHLRLDSGAVVCPGMLSAECVRRLEAEAALLVIPSKDARRSWEQRRRFAASLCDPELRAEVTAALNGPSPFVGFDVALESVPVERARWSEVERLEDAEHLCRWLDRAGLVPDPLPDRRRKIIEFPFARARGES